MLDLHYLREYKEQAKERLAKRVDNAGETLEEILGLDKDRRELQSQRDELQQTANQYADQIGKMYQEGNEEKAEELKEKSRALKKEVKEVRTQLKAKETALNDLLADIPNLPHPAVPGGQDESENEILYEKGNTPSLGNEALPHWELADQYDIIDFELGSKITGGGFPVYKGKGARLQRALINFFLDQAREAGYKEIEPPILVNAQTAFGTGQLPDKDDQMYYIDKDDLYPIPTAEVPLTNMYRNEIVARQDLPIKLTAYTPCFRREAGSYGKGVKGLNRVHQFDKVELVQIQHPNDSYDTLEAMREYGEYLLQQLKVPYRVSKLCAGDLGSAAAFTYDLEVYAAAQGKWLEVSSISNFESYQSNRMKIRYKEKQDAKPQLVHTLNGSGLAFARLVAALLENGQGKEGITLPEVLQPYTGFEKIN